MNEKSVLAGKFRMLGWIALGAVCMAVAHQAWRPISAEFFLARPCPANAGCHQTWTLTARLGQVLEFYEARLGQRSAEYRLLGVEFTDERRPGIRFPDYGNGQRSVIVQLTPKSATNHDLALFQLAHETFHLLEPVSPGGKVVYLEEGLASFMAIEFLKTQKGIDAGAQFLSEAPYLESHELVASLAAQYTDFHARLKQLRETSKSFSEITPLQLRAAFPKTDGSVLTKLLTQLP